MHILQSQISDPKRVESYNQIKMCTCVDIHGGYCNTLVLSIQLAIAFHEYKHHPSIHEHEHMKFHLIHSIFITCDVAYIHAYACDHV